MLKRTFLASIFAFFTCFSMAQPTLIEHHLFPGKPIDGFLTGNGAVLFTSSGVFVLDFNGNTVAADTARPVTAGYRDNNGTLYLTGMIDTNGQSMPYVRSLNAALQENFLQLLTVSSSYVPYPTGICCNASGRIYVAGIAIDSVAVPSRIHFFSAFDQTGSTVCSFVYAVGLSDQNYKLLKCDGYGNAVIGSDVGLGGAASGEMYFRKYDTNGNFLMENLFDPVYAKDVLSDFTFGTLGQTYLTGSFNLTGIFGNTLSALVLFDSSGLFSSFNTFDGYGYDEEQHILPDGAGSLYGIVSGKDYSGPLDMHFDVLRFDANGNPVWQVRHRDGSITFEKAFALALSPIQRLHVAGEHRDDTLSSKSGLVAVYDIQGSLLYEIVEPFSGADVTYSGILMESDSVFFTFGNHTNSTGDSMTIFVKYAYTSTDVASFDGRSGLLIYPNPAQDLMTVQSESVIDAVILSDLTGRILTELTSSGGNTYDVSGIPSGCYMVTVKGPFGILHRRLVLD